MENGVGLKIRDMAMGEAISVMVTECGKVFLCGEGQNTTPSRVIPRLWDGKLNETVSIVRCECTAAGVLLLDADGRLSYPHFF